MIKYVNLKWKSKTVYFSIFLPSIFYSQIILRNSDNKIFDSVVILKNNGDKKILDKANFKTFILDSGDKVLYNNKDFDFYKNNDTLLFFDKVKEIEEIALLKVNNKSEKKIKSSKKKRASSDVFSNQRIGTFVRMNTNKKTYIKSFSMIMDRFQINENFDGLLKIQLLKNKNGYPDDDSELFSIEKDVSELVKDRKPFTYKKLEFELPHIIRYPKEGFFIVLQLSTDKKNSLILNMNEDSSMYMFYPNEGWKELNINGYYYQLRVLQ